MQQSLSADVSHKLANMGFVCACLVVFIHVCQPGGEKGTLGWWLAKLSAEGICRIAVPFFFVAAGFFLAGHADEPGWWRRELGKRVRSLLAPYMLWSLLWVAYSSLLIVAANALNGAEWMRNQPLTWMDWRKVFGLDPFDFPQLVPLWFIRCLLLFVALAPLPMALVRRGRGWGLALLAALWVAYGWGRSWGEAASGSGPMFWWVTVSLEGAFYFTLGLFLRRWPPGVRLPTWAAWGMLAAAFGCFALAIGAKLRGVPWVPTHRWWDSALGLWAVWRLMPSTPWPRPLTSTAFPIYLMHPFALQILCVAHRHIFPSSTANVFAYLAHGTLAIAGSLVAALALRRRFPRAAGLLFGGR